MDPELENVVRRLAALEVEPGVRGNEMQASGKGDARIVVEQNIALERRFTGEHRADDGRRHAFESRVQVEREPPPGALAGDDDLAVRPEVRARRRSRAWREIVERSAPLKASLTGGKPGRLAKWAKRPPAGSSEFDVEREHVGGGDIG